MTNRHLHIARAGAAVAALAVTTTLALGPHAAPAGAETAVPTPPAVPGVRWAQQRLAALGYDVGPADGRPGGRTAHAVMAFQKAEGMARTGRLDATVATRLTMARPPRAVVPDGEATRVEVDMRRQILLFWRDGNLARVLPVSTGSGRRYCVRGTCEVATTPTGTFRVERRIAGTRVSALGTLYDPLYFHKGFAIHGSPSVPAAPASHGCVRIPRYAAASFADQVPVGTIVYIR